MPWYVSDTAITSVVVCVNGPAAWAVVAFFHGFIVGYGATPVEVGRVCDRLAGDEAAYPLPGEPGSENSPWRGKLLAELQRRPEVARSHPAPGTWGTQPGSQPYGEYDGSKGVWCHWCDSHHPA